MGKVLYGIKNVHVAKLTEASDGTITYGTPFAVDGAVGFSPEPQGESSVFYADDKIYFRKDLNNGYEGDLELAVTPQEFLTQILGRTTDTNGAVFEGNTDTMSRFALMFEAEGDPLNRRFCYYDCTASRPTREHATTEDTIEVGTETMTITIAPRSSDGVVGCYMEKSDTNTTAYNGFFTAVYEKVASV